jgi:hypothetical protein
MTTKDLSKRTLKYLRLLAKELTVSNPNSYSKVKLINQILTKGGKNITIAERKIQDIRYSYVKNVPFWGRSLNRKILISIGIALAIYTIFSLLNKNTNPNYFYSDLQFIGNIKFTTKNPRKEGKPIYINEMVENPLCGCKNEMPHYGLTFFSYEYNIDFLDSLNQITFPSIEISAPNHVLPSFSDESKEGNQKFVNMKYEPFPISFDYFKISQSDYLFNEQNLQTYIVSKYNSPSEEPKHIVKVDGINLKELTSSIHVVSLDDVFMSSFDPPYGTVINIERKISNIQDKTLESKIENDFSFIDGNKFSTPSLDILGRVNAFIFENALITDLNEKPILEKTASKDSIIILVAMSGFSQKIKPQIEKSNKIKKIDLLIKDPISDSDYNLMLEKFEKRREGFYKDTIKNANIQVSLVTPFVQNKPNGIHFYGEFESLNSNETKGKIQLGKLTETLDYTKSINLWNIDTMKLFTEPLVFQSNPNSNFKNTMMTSGMVKINESEFRLSTSEKILSYLWYFLDSLIGFLGSLFGLIIGLRGMSFPFGFKKLT